MSNQTNICAHCSKPFSCGCQKITGVDGNMVKKKEKADQYIKNTKKKKKKKDANHSFKQLKESIQCWTGIFKVRQQYSN